MSNSHVQPTGNCGLALICLLVATAARRTSISMPSALAATCCSSKSPSIASTSAKLITLPLILISGSSIMKMFVRLHKFSPLLVVKSCLATPSLAQPRQALPLILISGSSIMKMFVRLHKFSPLLVVKSCPALPGPASPSLALPCHA